ncbi:recombinase family protein [Paraburkholderia terrae]|uniref:recombinase family protein n=1 Tax=Paraburkholderia terrae TaxID=311230 RepID=UPI0020504CAD|nr:recombinase family protein [Paraburkholderia terrae]BDC38938.1 transposase [Paraburkholderia terrae]
MNNGKQIGYVRVSSVDQNTDRQLDTVKLDKTFTDKASGKDTNRPQLAACLDYCRDGDTLHVHSIDRLARNTENLLQIVRDLTERGVSVRFEKENLTFNGGDSKSPMDELMLTMLAGFAQFERSMIRERQREGIAIAKDKGVYKGRKPALTAEQIASIKARAEAGEKKAVIARDLGISRETLYQYLRT